MILRYSSTLNLTALPNPLLLNAYSALVTSCSCLLFFAWGFGEIVVSQLTDDIGDQFFWGLASAVLFNVVAFLIILKRDNRKEPKDTG